MRNDKTFFFLIPILALTIQCISTKPVTRQRLIAAEYRRDSPRIGNYVYLVAYNFVDGKFTDKDTILGRPTDSAGNPRLHFRFDLGRSKIYKNRYVISGIGNVIDIKKRKLLGACDDYESAAGDSMIFYRNNLITGTGHLRLDLNTGDYRFIDHDEKDKAKNLSPDKRHSLEIDQSSIPYKIVLHEKGKEPRVLVADAGHGPNTIVDTQFPTIAVYWINDHQFFYTIHKLQRMQEHTAISNLTIRKFDINNSADSIFLSMDSVREGQVNDGFSKDPLGNLLYADTRWEDHIVDTVGRRLLPYPYAQIGNDFAISSHFDKTYGRIIRYKEKEIGRLSTIDIRIENGLFAAGYDDAGSNHSYPKGIKVWSARTGDWTNFDVPWLSEVIGWIDEAGPQL